MADGKADFVPVVFGADTLGYSYAREFASVYGVQTRVVAPLDIKYTSSSRFTDYAVIPSIDSEEGIVGWLREHAGSFGGKTPVAIGGASDAHARTLSRNRPELERLGYAVPYASFGVLDRVIQKDRFYGICERLGMPHPKTWLLPVNGADERFACDDNATLERIDDAGFESLDYPVIAKPSNSAAWHYADLRDRHKVYVVESAERMREVARDVRDSGYDRYLVIQEMLDDSDDALFSLTLFCEGVAPAAGTGAGAGVGAREGAAAGARGEGTSPVPLRVSGHVLVQDRSATGIGNPLVILGESHPELLDAAERFLVATGYEGFANFDVMRDAKTGELKFLEVNARPGRNTYYVSLAGCSFVRPIVEHFVHRRPLAEALGDALRTSDDFMFSMLPPAVVRKEVAGRPELDRALEMIASGKAGNPLMNPADCLRQRFWALVNYEHMRTKF